MKIIKLIIVLCGIIILNPIYAQIGIGTTTPKAALDVVSSTQGILPPRMTGTQIVALTVGSEQNGMLVYATSTSGAITKIGYWYYDHTATSWKPFDGDITATNGVNIASGNIKLGGALTQATTVSGLTATNKMSFTGTGTDAFNVDGTTLSVDATNNRIGIGTATPTQALDVNGVVKFNLLESKIDTINVSSQTAGSFLLGLFANASVINFVGTPSGAFNVPQFYSDADGRIVYIYNYASQNITFTNGGGGAPYPSTYIYNKDGNVTLAPGEGMVMVHTSRGSLGAKWYASKLSGEISQANNGLSMSGDSIQLGGALTKSTTISGLSATNKMSFTGTGTDVFNVDTTTFSVDATNNRIGIGTSSPNSRLDLGTSFGSTTTDVVGKKLAIYNNSAGTDFYGLGISSGLLQFHASSTASEDAGMVLNSSGSVGIGTVTPSQRLHISQGNTLIESTSVNGTPVSNLIFKETGFNDQFFIGNEFSGVGDANKLYIGSNSTGAAPATADAKITLLQSGNMGIGTTSPIFKLDVVQNTAGNVDLARFANPSTDNAAMATIGLGAGSPAWTKLVHRVDAVNGPFFGIRNYSTGTEHLSVNIANGNVGIGSSTPPERLHIFGGNALLGGTGTGSVANPMLRIWSNANVNGSGGFIEFNEADNNYGYTFRHNTNTGAYGDDGIAFEVKTGGTYAPRIMFGNSGNLGIGTMTPEQRLHIAANNNTAVKLGQTGNTNGAIQLGGGNTSTTSGAISNWIDFYNGAGTLTSNLALRTDGLIVNGIGNANTLMNIIGGNVGIGNAAPGAKLHVYSNSSSSEVLRLSNNAGTYNYFIANNFNNANFGSGASDYPANGYANVLVQNLGGAGFFVFGDHIGPWSDAGYDVGSAFARWRYIYASNGTINTSDARVKSDIKEIPYGLSTVMKMKPSIYSKFKGFDKTGESKLEVGFIAQDLKSLIPTAVEGNSTDVNPMGINYDQITPVLTKAIQEQQVQIQAQKSENNELKKMLEAQSKEISELRAMIEKIAKH